MNYTKGEWKIGGGIEPQIIVIGDNGIHIAQVHQQDNAHLIAAAPDMYEALKIINQMEPKSMLADCAYQGIPPKKWVKETAPHYNGFNKALEQIKNIIQPALAKAEGRQ